jgi:hypothetical protein
MIAASSIQGIGAQSFSIAIRAGCDAVSGIEFGPNCFESRPASSLVRPFADAPPALFAGTRTSAVGWGSVVMGIAGYLTAL